MRCVKVAYAEGIELNLAHQQLADFINEHGHELAALRVVPADASPDQQRAWIKEAVGALHREQAGRRRLPTPHRL